MGRRAHKPDAFHRRQVEAMAGYGVPEEGIARVLAIDPKTLRRHYREELDTGHFKATAKVAESLFRKATGDGAQSVTAAIFWLKTRGGWRETPQAHEIAVDRRDLTKLTDEELERMIAEYQVAIAAEQAGIASLWAIDRLLVPSDPRSPYPGTPDGSLPASQHHVLDPLVTLTVAATVTDRIRLGTDVLVAPWYPPVLLARSLATLDRVSAGRLTVGLGVDPVARAGSVRSRRFFRVFVCTTVRAGDVSLEVAFTNDVVVRFYRVGRLYQDIGRHPRRLNRLTAGCVVQGRRQL